MSKPFKFRFVNELVGGFVLLVAATLLVGVYLAGKTQGWFVPVHYIYTLFPDEGAYGLRTGAEVRILETVVGSVHEIMPTEDGEIKGVFKIRGPFMQYVRDDSVAIVRKVFELGGDSYVQITQGVNEALPEDDPFIPCLRDTYLLETVQEALQQIRNTTLPAIEQLHATLKEYAELAANLNDRQGSLQQLIARLDRIAAGLERGEGSAGKLLRDEAVAEALEDIILDIREASRHLRSITGTVSGETEHLPQLVGQSKDTLQEVEELVEGIQKHWLVRKYMEPEEAPGRLPASALSGSKHSTP